MSALRGSSVDMARFMVALAPNRPDLRRALDHAIAEASGALRQPARPLEQQRTPVQQRLL